MPTTTTSTLQTLPTRLILLGVAKARALHIPAAWRDALLAWLAQHALIAGCFALGIRYGSHVKDVPTAWRILLVGWDGKDIAAVAAHGYVAPRDAAFYPLYPLLEHLTAPLFAGHFALAGWAIASLSALGAFGMLRILVEAETGDQSTARYALFFAAFSPFAVFLGLAYTEPRSCCSPSSRSTPCVGAHGSSLARLRRWPRSRGALACCSSCRWPLKPPSC